MKRKTKEILAFLTVAAISVSQIQFPAMADDEQTVFKDDEGEIEDDEEYDINIAADVTNYGTVYSNQGGIKTNEEDAYLETNESSGTVGTNKGSIENNEGKVTINDTEGTIGTNTGTVETNKGSITTNELDEDEDATGTVNTNQGEIGTNNGYVVTNAKEGKIANINNGNVSINKGNIATNESGGYVEYNFGTITTNDGVVGHLYTDEKTEAQLEPDKTNSVNYGTITTNEADIYLNAGKEDINNVSEKIMSSEEKKNYTGAMIKNNEAVITINNGEITNNGTVMGDTNPEIKENNGTVNVNRGIVSENNGAIEINFGEVTNNNKDGGINNNLGSIDVNDGTIGSTDTSTGNFGTIETNNGTVYLNAGESDRITGFKTEEKEINGFFNSYDRAEIQTNNGTIVINNGYVKTNSAKGTITTNEGTVDDNQFTVTTNIGTVNTNNAIVTTNSGTVTTNLGSVNLNTGTIGTNKKTVTENNGIVNSNYGTVENRNSVVSNYGLVENYGTVKTNSGEVYNYGGTVTDNSKGIEYFRITIVEGTNLNRSGGDLTNHKNQEWFGQKGNEQTTTSIIITPVNGFYIPDFKVPDNVTAEKKNDGTWVLTLTSGANINITLPNAKWKDKGGGKDPTDNSGGDSGNDGSENFKANVVSPDPNRNNPLNPGTQPQISATDNFGNPVTFDYAKVIEPISMITAINYMGSQMGMTATGENVKGCGTVNLTELFASSTADSISVPVTAAVEEGKTYEIHFSDGTVLQIGCTMNGVLNIPFVRGAESLTYIICGSETAPTVGT